MLRFSKLLDDKELKKSPALFLREPRLGRVKTRLVKDVGAEERLFASPPRRVATGEISDSSARLPVERRARRGEVPRRTERILEKWTAGRLHLEGSD